VTIRRPSLFTGEGVIFSVFGFTSQLSSTRLLGGRSQADKRRMALSRRLCVSRQIRDLALYLLATHLLQALNTQRYVLWSALCSWALLKKESVIMRRATSLLFCISFVLTSSLALADEFEGRFDLPDGSDVSIRKHSSGIGYFLRKTFLVGGKRKRFSGRGFVKNGQLIAKFRVKTKKKSSFKSRLGVIAGKKAKNDIKLSTVKTFTMTVPEAKYFRRPKNHRGDPMLRFRIKSLDPKVRDKAFRKLKGPLPKELERKNKAKADPKSKAAIKATPKSKAGGRARSKDKPKPDDKPKADDKPKQEDKPDPTVPTITVLAAALFLEKLRRDAKRNGKKIRHDLFREGLNGIRFGLSDFNQDDVRFGDPKDKNFFNRVDKRLKGLSNSRELKILATKISDFARDVDVPRLKSHADRLARSVEDVAGNIETLEKIREALKTKSSDLKKEFKQAIENDDPDKAKDIQSQFRDLKIAKAEEFLVAERQLNANRFGELKLDYLRDIKIDGIDMDVLKKITSSNGLYSDPRNRVIDKFDPTADLSDGTLLGKFTGVGKLTAYILIDGATFSRYSTHDANVTDLNNGTITPAQFQDRERKAMYRSYAKLALSLLSAGIARTAPAIYTATVGKRLLLAGGTVAAVEGHNMTIDAMTEQGRGKQIDNGYLKKRAVKAVVSTASGGLPKSAASGASPATFRGKAVEFLGGRVKSHVNGTAKEIVMKQVSFEKKAKVSAKKP
jgi:hypothetical protein